MPPACCSSTYTMRDIAQTTAEAALIRLTGIVYVNASKASKQASRQAGKQASRQASKCSRKVYLSEAEASRSRRLGEGMGSDRSMKGSRVTLVWPHAPQATLEDSSPPNTSDRNP